MLSVKFPDIFATSLVAPKRVRKTLLINSGVFFTYKMFWILLLLVIWMLRSRYNRLTLMGVVIITGFPVFLTFFAWDTTRVAGFGWMGLLMALGLFLKEQSRLPGGYRTALVSLVFINLLIPSYNVVIYYKNSLSPYPYPGLYNLFDSIVRHMWS